MFTHCWSTHSLSAVGLYALSNAVGDVAGEKWMHFTVWAEVYTQVLFGLGRCFAMDDGLP